MLSCCVRESSTSLSFPTVASNEAIVLPPLYAYLRAYDGEMMEMSGMDAAMCFLCPDTHTAADVSRSLRMDDRRARSIDTSGDVNRWLRARGKEGGGKAWRVGRKGGNGGCGAAARRRRAAKRRRRAARNARALGRARARAAGPTRAPRAAQAAHAPARHVRAPAQRADDARNDRVRLGLREPHALREGSEAARERWGGEPTAKI